MDVKNIVKEASELSVAERIQIVEDIWDTIQETSEDVDITEEQRAELKKRVEAHTRDPNVCSPWKDVKKRIRQSTK